MRQVSISELKAQLSAYLAIVRGGDAVLVTDRGRVVAQLAPAPVADAAVGRREQLLQEGRMRAPQSKLSKEFARADIPTDSEGRSLAAIIEERGEGW